MILFKNFFVKTVVNLGDKLLGANYLKSLEEWNNYDKMSSHELDKIQKENLNKLLSHAVKTVPFYKNYFNSKEYKFPLSLADFPVLTKEKLREQKESLVSELFSLNNLQKNFSSGSSGIQSYSYTDKKYKFYLQGIHSHWYMWSGYRIGDPILQFGISPKRVFPKNLKDLFYSVHYLNSFTLNENKLIETATVLKEKKIEYIIGYPSAINEFAKVLIKYNLNYRIKGVISLGDKLFPHFRKNFNDAFINPKIIDTYGCAEGLLMACTNDLDFYYIMSPNVEIEIVDDDENPVSDGEIGNVLVTSLTSYSMPLIRYKLGDLAIKLPKEKYPKDRKFQYPILEKIIGRETDVVITPNNKTLIVHSFTGIVEFYPEIKQFRIVQESIDKIIFEYIIDAFFTFKINVLSEIKEKIDLLSDNTLTIEFIEVDEIKPTPSGKPQIIESKIKSNSLK
ncbi:phenylacetate-CoA ligase [Flavobacterium lacus]|uniref:Phenylacetate-CoA ligase n=1 Tax=Flavobacterium lacus TaxID=1353778 RepID=A0A328WTM6_9FLAO|nr:phenylacetate-CoA ligase [Flavobacterium lacus]